VVEADYVHGRHHRFDYEDDDRRRCARADAPVLRNIAAALQQAGCTLDDVVRVNYFLAEAELFERVAPVFGQYFARARPAATAIVCGLVDSRMKIEIEVTARRRAWT
jgi:enamine deaminase RidA (YjgF/YER057c/UK114 family)